MRNGATDSGRLSEYLAKVIRMMNYYPVTWDKDTDHGIGTVHDNGKDIDHTKCGMFSTWCCSTLTMHSYKPCDACFPLVDES